MMKDKYTAFSESKMRGGRVMNSTLFTKEFNFTLDNKLSNIVFGISDDSCDVLKYSRDIKKKTLKRNQKNKAKKNNKSRRNKDK